MYEYLVTENRAGWQPWRERVPSWKYPRTQARAFFLLTCCLLRDAMSSTAHVLVLLNLASGFGASHAPRFLTCLSVFKLSCPSDAHDAWNMNLACAQAKPKFAQLLIPTVDSVRYEYLLALVLSVQKARLSTVVGISAPGLVTIAEVLWHCM